MICNCWIFLICSAKQKSSSYYCKSKQLLLIDLQVRRIGFQASSCYLLVLFVSMATPQTEDPLFDQCWSTISTLAQHWSNIGSMYCVCSLCIIRVLIVCSVAHSTPDVYLFHPLILIFTFFQMKDSFTPDSIHLHIARIQGIACLMTGLYSLCSLNFESETDKKSVLFGFLVVSRP